MTAAKIRRLFEVPAYRGGRIAITADTERFEGVIVGFLDQELRVRFETGTGPFTATVHPTRDVEYLPRADWTLTPDLMHGLWDQDGIKVHCKPHWAPAPAGSAVSTFIDGLTIGAHHDRPRQVARFGDRITWDADGRTYTVHPAAKEQQ